jgi:lipid-binding SYLF domain-containing protein
MKPRILLAFLLGIGLIYAENPEAKTSEAKPDDTAEKVIERSHESANVLDQIMATPDDAIPRALLLKARCVALIPGVKKAGFVFAGKYGKGFLSCRGADGVSWLGPSALRLEGGSFGFQVGGSSTDVILLVMNQEGVEKLLESKFTLGADAAVAGGPVGRSAQVQTDAQMHAKILAYSRSRGLFAGLSLDGATLRPDVEANRKLYGSDIPAQKILAGEAHPPESARGLLETLAKYATPKDGEEIQQVQVPAPAPPPQKEPEPTLLTVTSAPEYAEIELNHNFNGLTPRTKQIVPGEYQVVVNKKGFEPWTKTVRIAGGETLTVHAELRKLGDTGQSQTTSAYQPAGNSGIRVSGWQPRP